MFKIQENDLGSNPESFSPRAITLSTMQSRLRLALHVSIAIKISGLGRETRGLPLIVFHQHSIVGLIPFISFFLHKIPELVCISNLNILLAMRRVNL